MNNGGVFMNVDFSSINLGTVVMFALAILLAYLGIAVFKMIGRIISITIGLFLLIYVLQQIGISIPILTDILNVLLQLLSPIINLVINLFNSSK
jgi:hypothetical protein